MSDLIERQDAIDALADYIHNVDKVMGTGRLTADDCKDAATSVFEELPSAQPKVEKDTNVPINDCISRQAAIDGAYAIIARDTSGNNDVVKAMTAWKSYVEALPSVQPEQKKGKWIPIIKGEHGYSAGDFECSICAQPNHCYHLTNFCPMCGADMRKK